MTIAHAPAELSRPSRTAETATAPLRSRLTGGRAQATPKEIVSTSLTLPDDIAEEIALQFWPLAAAYRPTTAVGVNAVLELAVCLWKNRRLFEQYAAHLKQVSMQVHGSKRKRNQRLAIHWFGRLPGEPRRALAQLEQLEPGLKLIIGTLENMVAELQLHEGTWSSSQFETAVNLSGFTTQELWNDVRMRHLWGAWFGSFPNKDLFYEQIFRFQAPTAEYEARAGEAIRTSPQPSQARDQLNRWALGLIEGFEMKLDRLRQTDMELAPLACAVSDWPNAHNSTQHLLHLRYTNQVDRKTLELYSLLATVPAARAGEVWRLESNHLPKPWRELLMAKKPDLVPLADEKPVMAMHVQPPKMQSSLASALKPVEESAFDQMMEVVEQYENRNAALPEMNGQTESVRGKIRDDLAVSYQALIETANQSLHEYGVDAHNRQVVAGNIPEKSESDHTPVPGIVAQKRRLRSDKAVLEQPPSQRTLKPRPASHAMQPKRA